MPYLSKLKPFFSVGRKNGIKHASSYLRGLMQTQSMQGKNIERMEESVPEMDYQGVQQFISASPWDANAVMAHVAKQADEILGGNPESQLIIDESAFSKKGKKSGYGYCPLKLQTRIFEPS